VGVTSELAEVAAGRLDLVGSPIASDTVSRVNSDEIVELAPDFTTVDVSTDRAAFVSLNGSSTSRSEVDQ
jgi:hypothetical protein